MLWAFLSKSHLPIFAIIGMLAKDSFSQYLCPGSQKVCDQCPNQCDGPVLGYRCERNGPDPNYLKVHFINFISFLSKSRLLRNCALNSAMERVGEILKPHSWDWNVPRLDSQKRTL